MPINRICCRRLLSKTVRQFRSTPYQQLKAIPCYGLDLATDEQIG
ncbi:MAG: hypothetical protein ACXWTT_13535 [Methylobacter sp.]